MCTYQGQRVWPGNCCVLGTFLIQEVSGTVGVGQDLVTCLATQHPPFLQLHLGITRAVTTVSGQMNS